MVENFGIQVFFKDLEKVNDAISAGKVYIAYDGKNRKNFNISREAFEDAMPTLIGTPIVAYFFDDKNMGGHENDLVTVDGNIRRTGKPIPFGFVAQDYEPKWVKLEDNKEYVCAKCYIWTKRYPEANKILSSDQSMEISIVDMVMDDGYKTIQKFKYMGLCALNGISPTFEMSHFVRFSDEDIVKQIEVMKNEFQEFTKDTPAKPDEKIKGSDKNKEGSASTKGYKITLDDDIIQGLENKVKKHNEDVDNKVSKKVTLGKLKKVYRRGAGAYSTSHRPNMTRNQWAMGRVNAFLHLLKNGKPENKKYVTDNDLLPKGHPKKSDQKFSFSFVETTVEELENEFNYNVEHEDVGGLQDYFEEEFSDFAVPEKYNHINFKPTEAMAKAAKRGLEMRSKQPPSNRGGTAVGLARARQLINRQNLSPSTVKRMLSYFQRHEVDKQSDSWKEGDSKGEQAWLFWGGDSGFAWAKKIVSQMDKAGEKVKMSHYYEYEKMAIDKGIEEDIKVSTDGDKAIEGAVGEKDVGAMKRKVIMAKNYKTIIPKIFARYPENLDDFNMDDIGYPLMSERDGQFYYNTGFIKAASSRIEQQKDQPYYNKVRSNIVKARKKVGMSEEFTMKGDMTPMEYGMMKEMYGKYGMDRYMFAMMEDGMMYAMDMEEMKPMKMAYEMKEDMAVPMMDKMEMADDMMMTKEMMMKIAKAMYDMYMDKKHGYMSLEEEKANLIKDKEDLVKDKDGAFSQNKDLQKEVEELKDTLGKFALDIKKNEAEKIMNHADFSILKEDDKTELMKSIEANTDMESFKEKVESYTFKKEKSQPKKDDKFSMENLPKEPKNKESVDLYEEIKKQYNFK